MQTHSALLVCSLQMPDFSPSVNLRDFPLPSDTRNCPRGLQLLLLNHSIESPPPAEAEKASRRWSASPVSCAHWAPAQKSSSLRPSSAGVHFDSTPACFYCWHRSMCTHLWHEWWRDAKMTVKWGQGHCSSVFLATCRILSGNGVSQA